MSLPLPLAFRDPDAQPLGPAIRASEPQPMAPAEIRAAEFAAFERKVFDVLFPSPEKPVFETAPGPRKDLSAFTSKENAPAYVGRPSDEMWWGVDALRYFVDQEIIFSSDPGGDVWVEVAAHHIGGLLLPGGNARVAGR